MSPASEYLIQYGRPGFVGRFRSGLRLARGDRVLVRGPRGIEIGEVLVEPAERFTAPTHDGDVIRPATREDDAEAAQLDGRAQELLAVASERAVACALPLVFVDIEVTYDRVALLHALPWEACDASPLLAELTAETGLTVRLLDVSRLTGTPETPSTGGCGKPGCGSEAGGGCSTCGTGGGCSTGSCSRGAVKSSEELTAYFADLRQQMEAAGLTRTPLG